MTTDNPSIEHDVCESCSSALGEIGYVIREGDEVLELHVRAEDGASVESEVNAYIALAQSVSPQVRYQVTPIEPTSTKATLTLVFEVSAEKLIFELKSRHI